jgi:threonine dehydratase
MAYAARQRGPALTVFMDAPANPLKVARIRALGADVRVTSGDGDDAHAAARKFAAQHDARLVVDERHDRASVSGTGNTACARRSATPTVAFEYRPGKHPRNKTVTVR